MNNRKGFTLIELLGVFAILGIIMLVAIPNVMGILDKNKKNTYIEHAKQMVALAEYKMADTSITKPSNGQVVVFSLECLDTQDIVVGPDGGQYDVTESFVAITKAGGVYKYYVTLRENTKGLELISYDDLNKTTANNFINELSGSYRNSGTVSGLGPIIYEC